MSQVAALRAAAQAVAAITHGAQLSSLTLDGIEIAGARARGADVLSDVSVWIAGVAALDRLRFGSPADAEWPVDFNYDDDQRHDLGEAARVADEADPHGDRDLLYAAWVWATELMADDGAWAAIQSVAQLIERAAPSDYDEE